MRDAIHGSNLALDVVTLISMCRATSEPHHHWAWAGDLLQRPYLNREGKEKAKAQGGDVVQVTGQVSGRAEVRPQSPDSPVQAPLFAIWSI